jgi:hypothetical protein
VHLRLDRDVVDSTHNIFVGNLPWSLKNEQLQELFQPFRPIECQVLTNMYGKSRGFAIVKFSNDSDAQRAIAAMHMTPVNGRNIEVRTFLIFTGKYGIERFCLRRNCGCLVPLRSRAREERRCGLAHLGVRGEAGNARD